MGCKVSNYLHNLQIFSNKSLQKAHFFVRNITIGLIISNTMILERGGRLERKSLICSGMRKGEAVGMQIKSVGSHTSVQFIA